MHSAHLFTDMLGETGEREGLLRDSMRMIAEAGAGVVVIVNRPTGRSLARINIAGERRIVREPDRRGITPARPDATCATPLRPA